MRIFLIIPVLVLILVMAIPFSNAQSVPDWVKNTAGWWATDAISEKEFVNAITFLIKEGIIQVTSTSSSASSESVPDWVKNTAGWWATDAISEKEFVNAMTFLVNVGIISIEEEEDKCVNDLLKYFDNKEKIIDACDEHELMIHDELIPYENKLEINSMGFRGEEFSEKKQPDVYRIFMIGGSTMLSAEVSDDSTIPSILEKMLDSAELNVNIEVINAGISGSNTITELELIKSKLVKYEPDLIIMYDGWNDLSGDYTVEGTINNYKLICQEAIRNNFELIMTIQPIAGFGEKQLTFQEKINSITGQDHNGFQLIQASSTYDYLVREMMILNDVVEIDFNGVCSTHDLRNVFDNVSGPIYWDQGHVSHAGNLILAERFFEIIVEKIDSEVIPDSKFTNIISNYNSIPVMEFLLNQLGINEKLLQEKFQDISKISTEKGKYFQLKDEFADVSDIFVGKDLRNVDLGTLNLKDQDLTGANLSGHDLRNVDLTNTIIRGANLSNTNLEGKDLSERDLRGIDFSNAKLSDVDFTDSVFSKTIQISGDCQDENQIINYVKNFSCAIEVIENESIRTNFENADLTSAKFGKKSGNQMIYFSNFKNANLTNVNVDSAQFFGCDFTNAKLDNLTAKQMFIVKSDFKNTEMNYFDIRQTWIQKTSFNNAQMTNGLFDSITFIDTHFPETDLEGTNFVNLNQYDSTYNCENNQICTK